MSNEYNNTDYIKIDSLTLKALDSVGSAVQSLQRESLEVEVTRLNLVDTPLLDRATKVYPTAREHKFSLVTSRHDKIGYAAFREGSVPRTVEIELTQRRALPTMIGSRVQITELAEKVTENGLQAIGELVRTEKIQEVKEETEYLDVYGDRRFGSADENSSLNLQYDGVVNIVKNGAPMNVIDAQGKPLSLALLWAAESSVLNTQMLAKPSTVVISHMDRINLQATFYNFARTTQQERVQGLLGANATEFVSGYGQSELVPSRFVGDWHKFNDAGFGAVAGEYARPTAPGAVTAVSAVSATAGQGFTAVRANLTYAFKFANFNGESEAVFTTAIASAPIGNQVTSSATVAASVKWALVYVKDDTTGKFQFLCKVPVYGTAFVFIDNGYETFSHPAYGSKTVRRIPGTGVVLGLDFNVTARAEWIPLEIVALPKVLNDDLVVRHCSTLFSRAPEFNYVIVNVGQESVL